MPPARAQNADTEFAEDPEGTQKTSGATRDIGAENVPSAKALLRVLGLCSRELRVEFLLFERAA